MGKAGDPEQTAPSSAPATSRGRFGCRRCAAAAGKLVSPKCASVLLLSVGGFFSACFLLLHLRASDAAPDDPGVLPAEIQAGFILLMPYSQLASNAILLEKEIYNQIGVPNTKVSIFMHPYKYINTTYVSFGVLPEPRNTSISTEYVNMLRKSLIQLTLQQMNLSLTPSVFGDPVCLEILGFPGGITVSVPLDTFHSGLKQPLFNITFDLTIHQIKEYLEEMKSELQCTLKQTIDEVLFVELTNTNGSTVAKPVTVQVSLSTNDHSIYLQTSRLKQIAQIITEWNARNLGLNPSVFGMIKDLKLSPLLQGFMPAFAPSTAPTPIPSISWPEWPPCLENPKINPYVNFPCPVLMQIQNANISHRKLMHVHSR